MAEAITGTAGPVTNQQQTQVIGGDNVVVTVPEGATGAAAAKVAEVAKNNPWVIIGLLAAIVGALYYFKHK